jgi:hypothetical protein
VTDVKDTPNAEKAQSKEQQPSIEQPLAAEPPKAEPPKAQPRETARRPKLDPAKRGAFSTGLTLILVGLTLVIIQWVPELHLWANWAESWPLTIVGVGVLVGIIGLVSATPDSLIATGFLAGLGLLLYWQNAMGNWGSWAYAWALIPGFAGAGHLLAGLYRLVLGYESRRTLIDGVSNLVASFLLFSIFGSFLGGPDWLRQLWPASIIVLGLWILFRPSRRSQRQSSRHDEETRPCREPR